MSSLEKSPPRNSSLPSKFIAAIKKGGGEAMYKTAEGEELTVRQNGRRLEIIDAKGGKSFVTIADVNQ